MKPDSEASGVRSSWLALARKSARVRSTRRCSVSSRNTNSAWPSPVAARVSGRASTRNHRGWAPPTSKIAVDSTPPNSASSAASSTAGSRTAVTSSPTSRWMRSRSRAAELANTMRRSVKSSGSRAATTSMGSGKASISGEDSRKPSVPAPGGGPASTGAAARARNPFRLSATTTPAAKRAAAVCASDAGPVTASARSRTAPKPAASVAAHGPRPEGAGGEDS